MDKDELNFNAILAKAVAEAEKGPMWGQDNSNFLRALVAITVQSGVEPNKIYAMIKTGRILTDDNMKLLTKVDLKEWRDACHEYDRLAVGAKNNSA